MAFRRLRTTLPWLLIPSILAGVWLVPRLTVREVQGGSEPLPASLPAVDPGLGEPAIPAVCAVRRRRVGAALGEGLLVVEAGEPRGKSFLAAPEFFHLVGADLPGAVLVLAAERGALYDERLYLPRRDASWELWQGISIGPGPRAALLTGLIDTRDTEQLGGDLEQLGSRFEEPLSPARTRAVLAPLRAVHGPADVQVLRAAARIAQAALGEAFAVAVPGNHEYDAEAALVAGLRRRGARSPTFDPLCASGPNACAPHYGANGRRLEPGELLLIDAGARYRHLCAAISRTIPIDGRFSPRQREVYQVVWLAGRAARAELRPGSSLRRAQGAAERVLAEADFEAHCLSVTGHGVGLEVHSPPGLDQILEPGMVVAIESGATVELEALGIRIEDMYLIVEGGAECLTDAIPSQVDELEGFLAGLPRTAPR